MSAPNGRHRRGRRRAAACWPDRSPRAPPHPSVPRVRRQAARRDRPSAARRSRPAFSGSAVSAPPAAGQARPPEAGRGRRPASAAPHRAAPNAVIRGNSRGRPPEARRNASASARAARRVGTRINPRDTASASLPARCSHSAARASRNGTPAGIVNRFSAYPLSAAHAGWFRPRPDPPASRDGTRDRHAPARAADRPPWRRPRPGSC